MIATAIANVAATVNAGIDLTVTPPAAATLDGTVADDDGKPVALVTAWSKAPLRSVRRPASAPVEMTGF